MSLSEPPEDTVNWRMPDVVRGRTINTHRRTDDIILDVTR